MFLNKNKRKVNLSIDTNNSNNAGSGTIPTLYENNGSKVIDSAIPMDSSPSSVTMRKKFKMFSDDSMDTSPSSPVTLINYTHQPFDDFKKPFDCFVSPAESSRKGVC